MSKLDIKYLNLAKKKSISLKIFSISDVCWQLLASAVAWNFTAALEKFCHPCRNCSAQPQQLVPIEKQGSRPRQPSASHPCWLWKLWLRKPWNLGHKPRIVGNISWGKLLQILDKLNLVKLCNGGLILGLSQFLLLPSCLKKWSLLQKW